MMLAISQEALSKIFFTAVLLTGSVNQAELAISRAIGLIESQSNLGGRLMDLMIDAALFLNQTSPLLTCECESCDLPEELLRVAHLPSKLRSAFILRMFLNMPYDRCAELMNTSSDYFKELLCESILALSADPVEQLAMRES